MKRHKNTLAKLNEKQRAFIEYLHTLDNPVISVMTGDAGWLEVTDYSLTNYRGEELSDEQVASYEPHELYLHLTVIEKCIRGKLPVEVETLTSATPFVSSDYTRFLRSK